MNDRMWAADPVQRNCRYLRSLPGVHFVEPVEGKLATGRVGVGHLARVDAIIEAIDSVARRARS
jgi:phosphopantothenoylcysteine synthetase/decarboxylase